MALTRGTEIPTIDVALVTMTIPGETPVEVAIDTASEIKVTPQIETQDAVRLIIKGKLKAQKRQQDTIVGHSIVLSDNVFTPEVVKMVQGGVITTDGSSGDIVSYTPPVVGAAANNPMFELNCYSAIYNTAGVITGYEKIVYPNCQGVPVALNSKDNVFRVAEYTIISSPDVGEPPYKIEYIEALPAIT